MAFTTRDDEYWQELVSCVYGTQNNPCVARFGRLSRLNIAFLFNELVRIKADIRANGTTNQKQMDELALRMHQYGEH